MSYNVEVQAYQIGSDVPEWAQKFVEIRNGVTVINGQAHDDGKWLVVLPGETMVFTVSDEGFKMMVKAGVANAQAFVQISRPAAEAPRPQAQVGIRGVTASITKRGE
jgi:hypothetical protein